MRGIRDAFKVQAASRCRRRDVAIVFSGEQCGDDSWRASRCTDLDHSSDEKADHMMKKSIRGNHQRDAARPEFPPAETHIAAVIVVVPRRAFDGERAEAVIAEECIRFGCQQVQRRQASKRPFAVVAERAPGIAVGTDQIAVLTFDSAVTRMKVRRHRMHAFASDIAGQHTVKGAPKFVRLPFIRNDYTDRLTQCMNAGISSAGTDRRNVRLRQSGQRVFQRALYCSPRGLSLPTGKGLAVILNDQLEGAARHWNKARPPRK